MVSGRRTISVGALTISYLDFEGGNPEHVIVLLHGWGLSARAYMRLSALIAARGYRVVAPDLPGFGRSSSPPASWDFEDYAECVKRFMSDVTGDASTITLVGHSLGGAVAIALAARLGRRIEHLVLVDSAGLPLDESAARLCATSVIDKMAQMASLQGFLSSLSIAAELLRSALLRPGVMRRSFGLVRRASLSSALQSLEVPVTVMWAVHDMTITIDTGRRVAELAGVPLMTAGGRLHHDWCITHPREFVTHLLGPVDCA
jgi:pimeloyl-ACP methyl ester carboxylesterase